MIEKILKSIFRIFIFHEMSQKVYDEYFSVVYTMKTIVKYVFHEIVWKKYFTVYPLFKKYNKNIS